MIEENRTTFFSILIFGFIFDQLVKHLIRLGGGFYVCNFGIAWSFRLPIEAFYIFWFLVMGILSYWFFKKTQGGELSKLEVTAYALIFSGALSNFYDRIAWGCVMDFIDLHFWPVFNLADVFISVGVFFLVLKTIKK